MLDGTGVGIVWNSYAENDLVSMLDGTGMGMIFNAENDLVSTLDGTGVGIVLTLRMILYINVRWYWCGVKGSDERERGDNISLISKFFSDTYKAKKKKKKKKRRKQN